MNKLILVMLLLLIGIIAYPQHKKHLHKPQDNNPFSKDNPNLVPNSFSNPEVKNLDRFSTFSPKDYPYVKGANPFGNLNDLGASNANNQPYSDKIIRLFKINIFRIIGVLIGLFGLFGVVLLLGLDKKIKGLH